MPPLAPNKALRFHVRNQISTMSSLKSSSCVWNNFFMHSHFQKWREKNPAESSLLQLLKKHNRTRFQSLCKNERGREWKSKFQTQACLGWWLFVVDCSARRQWCGFALWRSCAHRELRSVNSECRRHQRKTSEKDHLSDRQHIWKAKSATPPLGASLRARRSSKFHFCLARLPRWLFSRTPHFYSVAI